MSAGRSTSSGRGATGGGGPRGSRGGGDARGNPRGGGGQQGGRDQRGGGQKGGGGQGGGGRKGGGPRGSGEQQGGRDQKSGGARGSARRGASDRRYVGGLHPVRELLRSDQTVIRLMVAETRDASDVVDEILGLARSQGLRVEKTDQLHLDEVTDGLVHQGVVAVAPPFLYADLGDVLRSAGREPALLVALDGVTDPHNLGSIARTAEAVGAHGLIIPGRRAASVTPTVEKAAAGALVHLPVVQVTNLVRTLADLHGRGVWALGLAGEAETELSEHPLAPEPCVLVVGAEGEGLSRLVRERCDALVRLPMRGQVGSLNASVAAGVALYELLRARGRSDARSD